MDCWSRVTASLDSSWEWLCHDRYKEGGGSILKSKRWFLLRGFVLLLLPQFHQQARTFCAFEDVQVVESGERHLAGRFDQAL
jgi:hypothetical protein